MKIRSTLNQALLWAQRRDLVARNVAATVELPHDAAPSKVGKTMTVDQAQQFLAAAAGTELEAMWAVMIYLGVRPGEAAGIAWNDIDFDNGIIHIWRARKASDNGQAIVGETKNAGSVRSLDTPTAVLAALRTIENAKTLRSNSPAANGPTTTTSSSPPPPDDPPTPKPSAKNSHASSRPQASKATGPRTCSATPPPASWPTPACPSSKSPTNSATPTSACSNSTTATASRRTVDGASAVDGLLNTNPPG